MPIPHILVAILLFSLFAGSLTWFWLFTYGLLDHAWRFGTVGALFENILLTVLVIFFWPLAIYVFVLDPADLS